MAATQRPGHKTGKIVQVIGSTFDAEFEEGHLPEIYNALHDRLRLQGRHDPADRRGAAAPRRQPRPLRRPRLDRRPGARHEGRSTPATPVQVPVGKETLGRVFNLLGEPIDGRGPVNADEYRPIHREPPPFAELSPKTELFETGIKVIDLLTPLVRGGKAGLFGGAGLGKTVILTGADRPHRQPARRLLGVRRRRRAHPRGQRPLAGNAGNQDRQHRPRGHHADGHGLRPDERAARRPPPRGPVGPDHVRVVPRRDRGRHAAVRRQHLPLLAGRLGSVGPAGPHAQRRRLPADAGHRDGRVAGAHHQHDQGRHHVSVQAVYVPADDPTDPAPANAFQHLDAFIYLERKISEKGIYPAVDPLASYSNILSAAVRRRGAFRRRPPRAADPAALPRIAGHHRHPRRRGAERGRQAGGEPGPAHREVPVAAVHRGRGVHRQEGQGDAAARTRSAASRSCATASGTTCRSRRSCTSAASRRPRSRPSRHGAKGSDGMADHAARPGRLPDQPCSASSSRPSGPCSTSRPTSWPCRCTTASWACCPAAPR